MAARLVGEAVLTSFIGFLVERLASAVFVNLFQKKKLNRKLVDELEKTLRDARRLLDDAERKQIKDDAVKEWLSNFEDAVYVADDLLDGVSTIAEIQKLAGNSDSHNYLNLQEEIKDKMEGIIARLESIVKQKDGLGLEAIPEENMSWRETTSLVKQSDIYGRDNDKKAVVELLLGDTHDGELSMVSIWGMGGIGKTTLAQLVYNDERVKEKFNHTAWVCVGENFDVFNVTKTIMEEITKSSCNMTTLNSLQNNLKEKLTEKTFLIVLDDVWSECLDDWNTLLKPFRYGNKGSNILLTTRNEKVSLVMQTAQTYELRSLSDEDCWLVFLKHSFLSTECGEYVALEPIGREIVAKCKGLPLAAETLGSLLRSKYDRRDWNGVLESEIWEFPESKIIPALKISYHYLPSRLKRCCVYCSLFPQDHYFDKDELILLWMAEEFLQPMGKKTLEEIGCVYFNELLAGSFFQPADKTITSDGYFVMHDLMHDLATFCAGEFYVRAEELGSATEIGCKTRHLSYNVAGNYPISKLFTACQGAEHMRTFVARRWGYFHTEHMNLEDFVTELISQLKFLRVLSFQFSYQLRSLPDSIGDLIHLRYLDLSNTYVVTLPESLSKLYNLQTLNLNGCVELKMLPSGMQDLVNLRHLDIEGTCLEEMPKAMSKLKHLQFLSNYIVGKDEENKIRELGPLAALHRSLDISNLENVVNSDEASGARIIDKEYINSLVLRWSSNSSVADSQMEMEREILDKLQPHPNLKELSIDGYRGTILSDWLGHSSCKNMTKLTLKGCKNCRKLPSLGQLPSLKHLKISRFDNLQSIGAEFYKSGESCSETPFRSLETLKFDGLCCWQEWRSLDDAFPQLKQLTINDCPMLIGDLPNHLPALERLTIGQGCDELDCTLPRDPAMVKLRMEELPPSLASLSIGGNQLVESALEAMAHNQPTCLRELDISDCDSAVSFPGDCLPSSLQELRIWNCKKLDFPMQQQQQHDSLRRLTIYRSCDSLTSFPLSAFPNLTDLRIEECENMRSLAVVSQSHDTAVSSLRSLEIKRCPKFASFSTLWMAAPQLLYLKIFDCLEIDSFPEGGLPPNLRDLQITRCEKLVSCLASMDLRSHGLTHLGIDIKSEGVKSFPKESWLPTSLESLELWHSPSVETLDCNGLSHLTSLQGLSILGCDKLENMTGERLPASLTLLLLRGCPLLGERCQVKDPQIRSKISHIPDILVDWRQIS